MGYYDDLQDAPDWYVYRTVRRGGNIFQRLWWFVFGMPDADALRDRYDPPSLTEDQEERVRQIVREAGDT